MHLPSHTGILLSLPVLAVLTIQLNFPSVHVYVHPQTILGHLGNYKHLS